MLSNIKVNSRFKSGCFAYFLRSLFDQLIFLRMPGSVTRPCKNTQFLINCSIYDCESTVYLFLKIAKLETNVGLKHCDFLSQFGHTAFGRRGFSLYFFRTSVVRNKTRQRTNIGIALLHTQTHVYCLEWKWDQNQDPGKSCSRSILGRRTAPSDEHLKKKK